MDSFCLLRPRATNRTVSAGTQRLAPGRFNRVVYLLIWGSLVARVPNPAVLNVIIFVQIIKLLNGSSFRFDTDARNMV